MFVSTPLVVVVKLFASGFGRRSGKGLFLCYRESSAADLLGVGLVDIWHDLFERCGIEALSQNRSPSDNVLACF